MAVLKNLMRSGGKESKEVQSSLSMLERNKVPVRMEIENSTIRFKTKISIRSATVVVAKPLSLSSGLSKGGTVRFKVPDSDGKEIRMEVVTPHFNLSNGNPVFLCKIPKEFAPSNKRGSMRYNTSKFTNVVLELSDYAEKFRIIDLSDSGCKIYVPSKESRAMFPVGKPLEGVRISLGTKVSVNLDGLTPRNHRGQAVGCQIEVAEHGPSRKYLVHLIDSLERSISSQFRPPPPPD